MTPSPPSATQRQALKSIPSPGSILIGGMDRGIDYSELIEYLSVDSVPHIILMEATGKRIYAEIKDSYPAFHDPDRLHLVEHLSDAVELAKKVTPRGSALHPLSRRCQLRYLQEF